ncbi:MAG: hypothetical protein ACJ76J_22980 [Thermoanaerobaculia bacterium]
MLTGKGLPVVRKGCALIAEGIQAVREGTRVTEEASSILRDVVSLGVDGLAIVREGFLNARALAVVQIAGQAMKDIAPQGTADGTDIVPPESWTAGGGRLALA